MSETAKCKVIDTTRTINDDVELITTLIQKYGLERFKNMLDKALNQVFIAQEEEAARAQKIANETKGQNEQRLNSLQHFSRLFLSKNVNPEALSTWLQKTNVESQEKILTELKGNKRSLRFYFHDVDAAITMLETEVNRKNQLKQSEKPTESKEDKDKKSFREKMKAFVT